jgi:hypothetical protein
MGKARTGVHLPGFKTGASVKAKLIVFLIVVSLLWWIISDPVGAAAKVTTVVRAVWTFVTSLRG